MSRLVNRFDFCVYTDRLATTVCAFGIEEASEARSGLEDLGCFFTHWFCCSLGLHIVERKMAGAGVSA